MLGCLKNFFKLFIDSCGRWSIGIYAGNSPYRFWPAKNVKNPVLTAKDVTDIKAEFVADPFMVREQGNWYMFFEVMNSAAEKGEIGLAVSNDGFNWCYKQIVLSERFHMSYPYVFKWDDVYYMIPESQRAYGLRLYKATDFPVKWSLVVTLLEGSFVDTSVVRYNNKWWLFTTDKFALTDRNDKLLLYFSDSLFGPWKEHPRSPVITGNSRTARCGGRILLKDGKLIRYAQDCSKIYGRQVLAFEIINLTETEYAEKEIPENPILKPSWFGWNSVCMHTLDAHELDAGNWIACVDGYAKYRGLKIPGKKQPF